MFELALLYFKYGNFKYKQDEHIQQKKTKLQVTTVFKKKNLFNWVMLSTLLRPCHIFEKVNFILSVSCNNENNLMLTLQLSLAKSPFN